MPTSARWEVANSPQITVKTVHSARADVGIGPYALRQSQNASFACVLERKKEADRISIPALQGCVPKGCDHCGYRCLCCADGYLSFVGFRPRGLVQGFIFRNRQRFRHGRAFDGYHIGAFAAFENSFNTYHVYWQARSHDDCDALVFFGRRTRILSHGQHFNRMTGGKI